MQEHLERFQMATRRKKKVGAAKAPKTKKQPSKLASIASKVAGAAGKVASFLPGPIGAGVKLLSGIFSKNHPTWFPDEDGANKISLNAPLSSKIRVRMRNGDNVPIFRPSRLMIVDGVTVTIKRDNQTAPRQWVTTIDTERISRFVLAHVRKVINAVYLRPTAEYVLAFNTACSLRALSAVIRRTLYEAENPLEFVPDQGIMRILKPDQLQLLRATLQRIEACFVTQIKLPLTMIDYLDWRYGYIHRVNMDDRAALVTYGINVGYDSQTGSPYGVAANALASYASDLLYDLSTVAQAAVDIREAFKDHPQSPTPGTMHLQYGYDAKEFALRANLITTSGGASPASDNDIPVFVPSCVDKDTTFVASTMSAPDDKPSASVLTVDDDTAAEFVAPSIIPTFRVYAAIHLGGNTAMATALRATLNEAEYYNSQGIVSVTPAEIQVAVVDITTVGLITGEDPVAYQRAIIKLDLCKALEYYNADANMEFPDENNVTIGLTYLSSNLGIIKQSVLRATHDHVVKCLTRASRKTHTAEMKDYVETIETGLEPVHDVEMG